MAPETLSARRASGSVDQVWFEYLAYNHAADLALAKSRRGQPLNAESYQLTNAPIPSASGDIFDSSLKTYRSMVVYLVGSPS